jgi:hypothetical protein
VRKELKICLGYLLSELQPLLHCPTNRVNTTGSAGAPVKHFAGIQESDSG